MTSSTLSSFTIPPFAKSSNHNLSPTKHIKFKYQTNQRNQILHKSHPKPNPISQIPKLPDSFTSPSKTLISDKVNLLASEFRSITEPIDRVKKLLHLAALLPPLEESDKVAENRVMGCTTQVWIIAEMDELGRMRFRGDSDSEISKGFCWCLIWVLDGAKPEEVMSIAADDLAEMNVGLYVKAQSRVNTWNNILLTMKKASQELILRRGTHREGLIPTL